MKLGPSMLTRFMNIMTGQLDSAAKFAAVGDFLMFISHIPVSCGVQYELLLADCKLRIGVMNPLGNTDIIRFIKNLAGTITHSAHF